MKAYLSEMLKRKDLLIYLVKSGLKAENRDSYLGYFWWLLDPLLNVVVYYFLVVVILGRGGEDYTVYLVIGLVVWRWTSTTVNASSKAITKYASIINQVYLPKSMFPIAVSMTQLFNFIFGLIVIAIFLMFFGVMPSWQIVLLPIIILTQLLMLLAVGMFLSYVCVFIKDIDHMITHVIRLFFYASPIIWEGSRLPEQYDWVVNINPIAILLNAYRDVLMYQSTPHFLGLFIIMIISILTLIFLLIHYKRNEHKIIKAL
ncbi:ABC transporter permease [Paraliobacillus zengyii]|uniref:ABC transporter permease n=1 Tax=Paraliobacillus zengyii TaxID=2213194 RepID=UPI000E3BB997|nr:ABC transporter permease [Paraliobacillus zengyii]